MIRKGRENYLCLLNLEDALETARSNPRYAPALGLMARWAEANPEGDLTGTGFPAWLIDLLGHGPTMGLADRRGECIHSACRHYSKCFVEKSRLRSHDADIIVANHALVMITAAMAALVPVGDGGLSPTRYVFDEGHHVLMPLTVPSRQLSAVMKQQICGAGSGGRKASGRAGHGAEATA